jgi:riboflavin synthase
LRRSARTGIEALMFTGIVEESGRVRSLTGTSEAGKRLVVETALDLRDTRLGDSIAVDGCCLTVVEMGMDSTATVAFDLGPETLAVTTLGALVPGARVHLERAVRLADRLGGHLVAGHVDAMGTVVKREPVGDALLLRIAAPPDITRLCIHKGSIAVDGVSLTLNVVDDDGFEVGLIPHTLEKTHLGDLVVGARVNLESDLIGKYVERLLKGGGDGAGWEAVRKAGLVGSR